MELRIEAAVVPGLLCELHEGAEPGGVGGNFRRWFVEGRVEVGGIVLGGDAALGTPDDAVTGPQPLGEAGPG